MIVRERLSADVHQELLGRILRGEFAAGQRLKDTELAEELGVSRTPVREALLRLEKESIISSQKHQGFSVKALEESEIRDVYPLVSLLECTALDSTPPAGKTKLNELRKIGRALTDEGADPLQRIETDSAWHQRLISDSGNEHLLRILGDLKQVLFRYEYAFMGNAEHVAESAREHESIAACLERGDCPEAATRLKAHWARCAEETLADFRASGGKP
jgi:Transcriptional regulators